jgi:hypothetical protein
MSRWQACAYCGVNLKRVEEVNIQVTRHDWAKEEKVKNPHLKRMAKKGFTGRTVLIREVPVEEIVRFCTVQDALLGLKAGLMKTLVPDPGPLMEMVEGPKGMEEKPI